MTMAVDVKRLSEGERVWHDRTGEPINLDRAYAKSDRQMGISRRTQALLAAAGEDGARRWYVLRVADRQEIPVDNALDRAGVESWLPTCDIPVRRRGRVGSGRPASRVVPIWPGYLFVRTVNTAHAWAGLATVDGVVSVLGTADSPAPVSDYKLLKLKLELTHDKSAREVLADEMKPGQRVRIEEGPFASFEGLVKELAGFDRARVEVYIFGRSCLMELNLAQLAKIR